MLVDDGPATIIQLPTKKVSCLRPFKLLKAKYLCELYTRVITHVNKLRDLRHLFTHVNTRIYAGWSAKSLLRQPMYIRSLVN